MERISLRSFFICMPVCATLVLVAIWLGEDSALPEWYFKIAATAFVFGLASFLTWFVHIAYRLYLSDKNVP